MGLTGPFCQSFGLPLAKDIVGGTNADGAICSESCSYYYQRGISMEPEITAAQIPSKVITQMKTQLHFLSFVARFFTKDFSQLQRWQPAGKL